MIDSLIADTQTRMEKSIEAMRGELAKLRSGRAHPSLLDQVRVDYYGQPTPLSQVATITVEDARTLAVSPWEKPLIPTIEKAIMSADLGLNPATSGQLIRVPLPPLTEQRRKEMVKLVRQEGEQTKIAIRNIRRDANAQIKDLLKNKAITEDDDRRSQERIQQLTDGQIKQVDDILSQKETDLMSV